MSKSMKFASVAAVSFAFTLFLLATGMTVPASAQPRSFEAPAVVLPSVATPVEPETSVFLQGSDTPGDVSADAAAAPAQSLEQLVSSWAETPLEADARCLAAAVFFEARSESLEGQLAVADVVLGRVRSGRFPTSICNVLTQKGQFGFVRRGRIPDVPTSRPAWRTAQAIAQIAMDGSWKSQASGALYFHAVASPMSGREEVAQIGNHIFYR